jgi:capsular exopolysaccharide synthesis family protein
MFLAVEGIGVAAVLVPPKQYRATATLLVEPSSSRTFDFGSAGVLEFLMPVFIKQITTESFQGAVRGTLPPSLRGRPLELDAESEPGTGLLLVGATDREPDVAATVANAAARRLIAQQPSRLVRVSVLDPARPSGTPASPQPVPIFIGSTVLGAIVAILLALALNAHRGRLRNADAMQKHIEVDVLGEIPSYRRMPGTAAQAFARAPHIRDAYRKLAARLQVASQPEFLPHETLTIGVTSWAPREGKTTVTANLAWALALASQPTIAVDADLRRPSLHRAFELEGTRGIADIARGTPCDAVIASTELPSLVVVPGGTLMGHPVDVVGSALPKIFAGVSEAFVLVDSPPVLSAETTTIATVVDAMILVIDGRRAKPEHVERTLRELELVGTRVLGVVINRARVRRPKRSSAGHSRRAAGSDTTERPSPARI